MPSTLIILQTYKNAKQKSFIIINYVLNFNANQIFFNNKRMSQPWSLKLINPNK
jgi:hypothetical protein